MAEVDFEYETADIADEKDIITWRWSVVNNLAEPVSKVVLTHRVSPVLPIERVTGPSEVVGDAIKSRWETLAAGERAEGEITAKLPADLDGSVEVQGRIVWQRV